MSENAEYELQRLKEALAKRPDWERLWEEVSLRAETAEADLDAGREWMRRAWHELNAIKARSGAPEGVAKTWWAELTDALGAMLGDDTRPWMLGAARKLIEPYEARAENAEARVADLERALAETKARVLALEGALRQLLDASEADYGVPDENDSDDESVALGSDGNSKIVFGHLRRARAVLAGGAAERLLHVKSGHLCTVLHRSARLQTSAPLPDMEPMVVYEHDGNIWVRPASEFNDGRFVPIADAKGDDNA